MDGLLLVDKPPGPTSHDIVARVRRLAGQRRVGHAGTLDPAASGLLPVVLGAATRLVRFLPHSPKRYEGAIRLGLTTDSDDLDGEVLRRHEGDPPTGEAVRSAAAALRGTIRQRAPDVSAKKVGGQRLYRLARRRVAVDAPVIEVEVGRFDLLPVAGEPWLWRFTVEVSAGTYIRALARDLGQAIGCGGALAELRRTAIGPIDLERAAPLPDSPEALAARLLALEAMPLEMPTLTLADARAAVDFLHGRVVPDQRRGASGIRRVVGPDGRLLGIGEAEEGAVRPRVVVARPGAV